MAESATLDKIRAAGRYDDLVHTVEAHLATATDSDTKTRVLEACKSGGLMSKDVMAVVGTLQRQNLVTPGLYKDLVVLNDAVLHQTPAKKTETKTVNPETVKETTMPKTAQQTAEKPASKKAATKKAEPAKAEPVKETAKPTGKKAASATKPEPAKAASKKAATKPEPVKETAKKEPAKAATKPEPVKETAKKEAPARPADKEIGNGFRRRTSLYFNLEAMRDGVARTFEEAQAEVYKRFPIAREKAHQSPTMFFHFQRLVNEGAANADGYKYKAVKDAETGKVTIQVTTPAKK